MKDEVQMVSLSGELTAAVAPEVRKELRALLEKGHVRLLLDMSGVSFIDSSGLSALVVTFKAARGAGGDVVLLRPQPTVRSLIELTRLHHVFQIFDDRDVAQRAMAA